MSQSTQQNSPMPDQNKQPEIKDAPQTDAEKKAAADKARANSGSPLKS